MTPGPAAVATVIKEWDREARLMSVYGLNNWN
jgi:hypothetical protein